MSKQVNLICLELLMNEMVGTTIAASTQIKEQLKDVQPKDYLQLDSYTDDITYKLESIGYNTGLRLAELISYNENTDMTNGLELLNVIKFICRDVWKEVYGKQIDNLRTNHKGTFVLIANQFKPFDSFDEHKNCKLWLNLPCGLIRGVLKSFGVESAVSAEITKFPSVSFSIQT